MLGIGWVGGEGEDKRDRETEIGRELPRVV